MPKSRSASRRRRALVGFMRAKGLKPGPWADAAGVNPNAIYNFLNNRSQSLSQETLERLAEKAGAKVSELTGESPILYEGRGRAVPLVGEIKAGEWREASDLTALGGDSIVVPGAPDIGPRDYALIVRGESMNKIYPDGTVVVCRPLPLFERDLKRTDKVHVERRDKTGLVEATIKEIDQDSSGRFWLWPRSTEPEHQLPYMMPSGNGETADPNGTEHAEVRGVVIYAIRKET